MFAAIVWAADAVVTSFGSPSDVWELIVAVVVVGTLVTFTVVLVRVVRQLSADDRSP